MYADNSIVVFKHEVCKIIGKKKSDFTGEMCYILEPYYTQSATVKMQVPISNKAGHLRPILTKDEVEDLLHQSKQLDTLVSKQANMKSSYSALMKTNDVKDLLIIIKTSYLRNKERQENNKKLAAIDHEYLEKAEHYFYNEISLVLDMSYEQTKTYFEKAMFASDIVS